MRSAFIRDHRGRPPAEVLCEALRPSRGGHYARARRPPGPAALRRDRIVEEVRQVHGEGRATYGPPRASRAPEARGAPCRENTAAEPMKAEGVRPKAGRPPVVKTTDGRHDRPVAADILDREFYPDRPDAAWTADITHAPTAGGRPYLAAVLDLLSRRAAGRATADHLRSGLTCGAPRMASVHREPGGELLHRSDRGVQYAGEARRRPPAERGVGPSMSRAGDCRDNAATEGFFSTPKREPTRHESYAAREEAGRSLSEYIGVPYNRRRLHSTLGHRNPAGYEVRFAS